MLKYYRKNEFVVFNLVLFNYGSTLCVETVKAPGAQFGHTNEITLNYPIKS